MEAQLAEYRANKEKQRKALSTTLVQRIFGRLSKPKDQKLHPQSSGNDPATKSETIQTLRTEGPPRSLRQETPIDVSTELSYTDWRYYLPLALKAILWVCLWKYFIEIGFGAVYFIVTCSYLMYRNTRTGPKEKGRLSAYSVFNPNHERLDGTFTAEQFEKELRMGAGSVK